MQHEDQTPPDGFECWDDEASLEENVVLNERLATVTDEDFVDGDEVRMRLLPNFNCYLVRCP